MKLIVGLGNPGKEYALTRHNVGFMVVNALINELNLKVISKYKGELALTSSNGEQIILFKPQTYMNASGEAVRLVSDFYKIAPKDILVIYDDLDLPVGKVRLREKGSAGGHNGMKSIIQHLNTQEFPRLRIGIDKNPMYQTVDYVLGRFSKQEEESVVQAILKAKQAAIDFPKMNFTELMNRYNKE
jgi:peptidyl-tRNA hydrolase, PTH1 family